MQESAKSAPASRTFNRGGQRARRWARGPTDRNAAPPESSRGFRGSSQSGPNCDGEENGLAWVTWR